MFLINNIPAHDSDTSNACYAGAFLTVVTNVGLCLCTQYVSAFWTMHEFSSGPLFDNGCCVRLYL
jgi:hypothetical protein